MKAFSLPARVLATTLIAVFALTGCKSDPTPSISSPLPFAASPTPTPTVDTPTPTPAVDTPTPTPAVDTPAPTATPTTATVTTVPVPPKSFAQPVAVKSTQASAPRTTQASAPKTTQAAGTVPGTVTPGAFCSGEGSTGVTNRGVAMRCTFKTGDIRARWRAA